MIPIYMYAIFTPHVTVFWPISHDFADIELKIGTTPLLTNLKILA